MEIHLDFTPCLQRNHIKVLFKRPTKSDSYFIILAAELKDQRGEFIMANIGVGAGSPKTNGQMYHLHWR